MPLIPQVRSRPHRVLWFALLAIALLLPLVTPRGAAAESLTLDEDASRLFEAGEHPRLLLSPDDVATLRARAGQQQFQPVVEAIRDQANTELDEDQNVLYASHIRDLATMYLLTGEDKYADRAARIAERIIDDEQFWQNTGSKGLTRAAGAWNLALAYDFCYDAWPAALRKRVSGELTKGAEGLIKSMGAGANNNQANNWQAVRYGAAGLALLASDEPGSDEAAKEAYERLIGHLRANLGPSAWNPEGIGYIVYPWQFTGPMGIAARRAGIGDLREELSGTNQTLWTTMVGTVNIPHTNGHGLRADLSDDHPAYRAQGTAGMTFWYSPDQRRPAVRWMYDYLHPDEPDVMNGGALYTLLLYPDDLEPANPEKTEGLTYVDEAHGVAIFRNRYRDENDIVAVANAAQRRPSGAHNGPDTNTIRLIGLGSPFIVGGGRTLDPAGQTNLFAGTEPPARGDGKTGKLVEVQTEPDGSGRTVMTGSVLGVEDHRREFVVNYTDDIDAEALFVNTDTSRNGKLWRLNTPEFNTIQTDVNHFYLIAPDGATLRGTVLEPKQVTFGTGQVERGGGAGHVAYPYRGEKHIDNKYLEFEVDGQAAVVMTLHKSRPEPLAIDQARHAARVMVGDTPVVFNRGEGRTLLGEDATGPEIDALMDRQSPLPPRALAARVISDQAVHLSWPADDLGADQLVLQRQAGEDGDWQPVARVDTTDLKTQRAQVHDRGLQPNTTYRYRLAAVNQHGRSTPAVSEPVTTWQQGYAEHVEDFAPEDVATENRLGAWHIAEASGTNFSHRDDDGSPRNAEATEGFLATGSVPIRQSRAIYNEDIRADLAGESAQISFDYRAQATTVFSVIFKLPDGRWVGTGRKYTQSRYEWDTLTFHPAEHDKWWEFNPADRKRGKEIDFDPAQLDDVRGVGVFVEWVINQKFAHLDQLHLRARNLHVAGD